MIVSLTVQIFYSKEYARTFDDRKDEFGLAKPPYTENIDHTDENSNDTSVNGCMRCVFVPEGQENLGCRNFDWDRDSVRLVNFVNIMQICREDGVLT